MDVSLEVINKSFGSVRVLKDVSLKFPSRKFVTLLGPSGCGKTTLLRMIAGLETVDSGIIRFGEKVVNRLAPRDRNIAMVFQSYALYPQMSVRPESRLRASRPRHAQGGTCSGRRARRPHPGNRTSSRPEAGPTLGRPAPAGGARQGHGSQARHLPDGRTAVQPRRPAADHDARRAQALPPRSRRNHRLRDARSARSHDNVGPCSGHERRRRAAVRDVRRRCTDTPRTCSSRASSEARP